MGRVGGVWVLVHLCGALRLPPRPRLAGGAVRAGRAPPLIDLRPRAPLAEVVDPAFVTADSDLRSTDREVAIVTTAALPWMTGTAVNPVLRAAYMADRGYAVALVLPWLDDPADQAALFGAAEVFATRADQERHVRDWVRANAPDAPRGGEFEIAWYPARYSAGVGSILNMDDIMAHIPREWRDVVVLEEPEHLNWYRNGPRWTSRFRHVVGVGHTNYEAYAATENTGARLAERVFTETVTRAHCDVVVQLSATLRPLPHSRVSNVHGVRRAFLEVGDAGGPRAFPAPASGNRCYFLGKALWAKGYDQLVLHAATAPFDEPRIDCFGGGPDAAEIRAKAAVLDLPLDFLGAADHADASIFGGYDVFVNPSISEVLCTATAEALAMGKRVVIARHPSNAFFYDFGACTAVAPGDGKASAARAEGIPTGFREIRFDARVPERILESLISRRRGTTGSRRPNGPRKPRETIRMRRAVRDS